MCQAQSKTMCAQSVLKELTVFKDSDLHLLPTYRLICLLNIFMELLLDILMGNMVDTSRAWFFISWHLQSREDKTWRKNYNISGRHVVGVVEVVNRYNCPQGK